MRNTSDRGAANAFTAQRYFAEPSLAATCLSAKRRNTYSAMVTWPFSSSVRLNFHHFELSYQASPACHVLPRVE
jgi:hypothetical protein